MFSLKSSKLQLQILLTLYKLCAKYKLNTKKHIYEVNIKQLVKLEKKICQNTYVISLPKNP